MAGRAAGRTGAPGEVTGSETVSLTPNQMPAHNHRLLAVNFGIALTGLFPLRG